MAKSLTEQQFIEVLDEILFHCENQTGDPDTYLSKIASKVFNKWGAISNDDKWALECLAFEQLMAAVE